jgi:DNA ligase-1
MTPPNPVLIRRRPRHSGLCRSCRTRWLYHQTSGESDCLGVYFASLHDTYLALAARYFAGTIFAMRDQRTANVGGAALLTAILEVTAADENHLRQRLVQLGDIGDAAQEAFAASPRPNEYSNAPLTLEDLAQFFETLASTTGTKRKIGKVAYLLQSCSPLEAKYVVKLLSGDLRIGLKEGAVEDALARASGATVAQVQWANMLTGDIGKTALLARHERLDTAQLRLFHPIKFMLASPAADLSEVARQMPQEFAVEDKFDGVRAQAHIAPHRDEDEHTHGIETNGFRIALFSRTLDEITGSFRDLLEPLSALGNGSGSFILDGEIVPVQGDVILPFQPLQKRLGRKTVSGSEVQVAFIAYDILFGDNRVLMSEPMTTRRAILEALPFDGSGARLASSKIFREVAPLMTNSMRLERVATKD